MSQKATPTGDLVRASARINASDPELREVLSGAADRMAQRVEQRRGHQSVYDRILNNARGAQKVQ